MNLQGDNEELAYTLLHLLLSEASQHLTVLDHPPYLPDLAPCDSFSGPSAML